MNVIIPDLDFKSWGISIVENIESSLPCLQYAEYDLKDADDRKYWSLQWST